MSINVVELFAGVGGFRVGLERVGGYNFVWANQWEPSTKIQHAFNCYVQHFGESPAHNNEDISLAWKDVRDHDLLVGGFPCQDYSVARSLSGEKGIQGKKGVLFWEIMNIVRQRQPRYVLLENVDRLLKSPASQRGRDFSIMLKSFHDEGYCVEWRVINAAEYGYAQRRRRVFIFAYKSYCSFAEQQLNYEPEDILLNDGFFASVFPVQRSAKKPHARTVELLDDIIEISDTFKAEYASGGVMYNGVVTTLAVQPIERTAKTLGAVVEEAHAKFGPAPEEFYLDTTTIKKNGRTELQDFEFLKGPKKIERKTPEGHVYFYSEGGMAFPDSLDLPGRTMLTSEGTTNRSSHVILDPRTNRLRYLTPVECELLNDFPMDWTNSGMPLRNRYFMMGNALVCGLVTEMGQKLKEIHAVELERLREEGFEQMRLF